MKYQCVPEDAYHYAKALSLNESGKRLMWEAPPGQGSLLVQTPFGRNAVYWRKDEDPASKFREFAALLAESCPVIPEGSFQSLSNGFFVRYVSASERVQGNGCKSNGEASTYTVFPCDYDEMNGQCTVYLSCGWDYMAAPCCHVPLKVRIGVAEVYVYLKRFFFSRQKKKPLEFHAIVFHDRCDKNYRDGDLEYRVDDRWRIPITREMFDQGAVYIRTREKPVLSVCNAGFELVLSDDQPLRFYWKKE